MNIVITGDRSANPGAVLPIVQQTILNFLATHGAASPSQLTLVTGLDKGVEAAARFVFNAAGFKVVDLEFATKDWQAYGEALKARNVDKVYFIHGDVAASSLYQGVAPAFDDDQFELVDPELLFSPA